ncbi:MAG: TspO/MBR family protein [Patescibacteria group bacterium]
MKLKNPTLLIVSLFSSFSAAALGSFFTVGSIPTWYATVNKPVFSPPNWIFGPVWTLLYFLMSISLYLVFVKIKKNKQALLWVKVFCVHLIFNSLWSIVFFGMKKIGLAFIVILILWGMIFYLAKTAKKISPVSSYLLYPYLAWVSFATLLNFAVWRLN